MVRQVRGAEMMFAAFVIIGNVAAWALVRHSSRASDDYARLRGEVFRT